MDNYLPLTEYSNKYKVSISTLRRRIKANDIQYRLEYGKYFIFDDNLQRPSQDSVGSSSQQSTKLNVNASVKSNAKMTSEKGPFHIQEEKETEEKKEKQDALNSFSAESLKSIVQEESVLTTANKLLTELKKAYTQILQEKEEQILNLKEELSDLKTLVRVLESENERLNR